MIAKNPGVLSRLWLVDLLPPMIPLYKKKVGILSENAKCCLTNVLNPKTKQLISFRKAPISSYLFGIKPYIMAANPLSP
jgi:hypothetical protein